MKIACIPVAVIMLAGALPVWGQEPVERAARKGKAGRVTTPAPTRPPLEPVDIATLPAGVKQLDLYLLMGQSNMKGRGFMPEEPTHNPRIMMMHLKDDAWYLARHPLHLIGDPHTFVGYDNAGVGPGLVFAEKMRALLPKEVRP